MLNLISNAFKFTLEGSIRVELEAEGNHVELRVRDTGVGIAPSDLGRIFERFHQAARSAARTHEGSGIGLALVQELVTIHAGTIQASSKLGRGTEFVVRIPSGTAHLPRDRVVTADPARVPSQDVDGAAPFVEEALRWLPDGASGAAPEP